jgi:predicted RNA binding protein YcfA (HicA-like mRNA interferase family)
MQGRIHEHDNLGSAHVIAQPRFVRRPKSAFSTPSLYAGNEDRDRMPPKIRELISDLERSGFIDRGGKGSHRNFVHPKVTKPITISGASGDEAKHYQVRAVRRAIEESKT